MLGEYSDSDTEKCEKYENYQAEIGKLNNAIFASDPLFGIKVNAQENNEETDEN